MPSAKSPRVDIIYIGGPTVTIAIDGLLFVTDPTLDPAGAEYPMGETL